MESSDDSFAWTNASSAGEDSDEKDEKNTMTEKHSESESEVEVKQSKKKKKKTIKNGSVDEGEDDIKRELLNDSKKSECESDAGSTLSPPPQPRSRNHKREQASMPDSYHDYFEEKFSAEETVVESRTPNRKVTNIESIEESGNNSVTDIKQSKKKKKKKIKNIANTSIYEGEDDVKREFLNSSEKPEPESEAGGLLSPPPRPRSRKRKHERTSMSDSDHDYFEGSIKQESHVKLKKLIENNRDVLYDNDENWNESKASLKHSSKKKKHKKNKYKDKDGDIDEKEIEKKYNDVDEVDIEEKFSADETVVETRTPNIKLTNMESNEESGNNSVTDVKRSKKKKKKKRKNSENTSVDEGEDDIKQELLNSSIKPESPRPRSRKRKHEGTSMSDSDHDYFEGSIKQESHVTHLQDDKPKKPIENNGDVFYDNDENETWNESKASLKHTAQKKKHKKNKYKDKDGDIDEKEIEEKYNDIDEKEIEEKYNDIDEIDIEEKFSAEETVVETRTPKRNLTNTESNEERENNSVTDVKQSKKMKKKKEKDNTSADESGDDIKDTVYIQNTQNKTIDRDSSEKLQNQLINKHGRQENQEVLKTCDRIQFEDEPVIIQTVTANEDNVVQSYKLKKYLKANTQLQSIKCEFDQDSLISKDDDIWVFNCPYNIDPMCFKGTNLSLDNKCKIKINSQTYIGNLENEHNSKVAILAFEHKKPVISNFDFNGIITFHKRIPKPHVVDNDVHVNNQTDFIPLPDTKTRHPLLGIDYKKALKIPSSIKARLTAVETLVPSEKKKKHKIKHGKERPTEMEQHNGPDEASEGGGGGHKRRHAGDNGGVDDHVAPRKRKRIKKESCVSESWDSAKAIEDNLFNF